MSEERNTGRVLLVDDDGHLRNACKQSLELAGYEVRCFARAEGVVAHLARDQALVLVTDIKMPGSDGLDLLRQATEIDPDLSVVLITGHGDIPMAVEAMRAGAYDFIEKPFAPDLLIGVVGRAMERRRLLLQNRALQRALDDAGPLEAHLLGRSPEVERLRGRIEALAAAEVDVLVEGETGSGKGLCARLIHQLSERAKAPFVAINCGALPETIIESELFGHEAGAFTGATKSRIGKFEHASGGTLFLDEIESMPLDSQVRLLRVLEERVVERLGSNESRPLDLRVIAATKVDLKATVEEQRFRSDLYFRLNVVTLHIPSLRERSADIPLLFEHFRQRAARRLDRATPASDPELLHELLAHDWPGNVRELQNAAERHLLGFDLELAETASTDSAGAASLRSRVDDFERSLILAELERQGGNVTATCQSLKVPRKTLYEKMHKHGISRAAAD